MENAKTIFVAYSLVNRSAFERTSRMNQMFLLAVTKFHCARCVSIWHSITNIFSLERFATGF